MKTRLGMDFHIDYAHKLQGHPKCGREHGHTARIQIEIEGVVKGGNTYKENMIVDFADMEKICKDLLDTLDHRNLNELFEFPTSENIAKWIFEELAKKLAVNRVTFFEGEGKWCVVEK